MSQLDTYTNTWLLVRACLPAQAISAEIAAIADGSVKVSDSPLKAAPHTWDMCFKDNWTKPYTREQV